MIETRQTAISLAQWSLVSEFHSGKIKTLDFPGIAKNDFGVKGIELVNTLMEVPSFVDSMPVLLVAPPSEKRSSVDPS